MREDCIDAGEEGGKQGKNRELVHGPHDRHGRQYVRSSHLGILVPPLELRHLSSGDGQLPGSLVSGASGCPNGRFAYLQIVL